jgi:hypothetical protein
MMKPKILFVVILFAVFFAGFLSGSLWQTLLQNLRQVSIEQSVHPITEAAEKMPPTLLPDEEKISQALTDPDFKRVHDYLMREKPIQMKISD